MSMTKGDRDALRSLIKQRFNLLRRDVEVRRAEMIADLDRRLDDQFAPHVKAWDDALFLIQQARDECNRAANSALRDVCKAVGHDYPTDIDYDLVVVRDVGNPIPVRKKAARTQAFADIEAITKQALHELASTENALLTDLLTSGLETAEAREFIDRIPTVSTLMIPTARLTAIVGPADSIGEDPQ